MKRSSRTPAINIIRIQDNNVIHLLMKIEIIYRHVHERHENRSRDPSKVRPSWFSYENCFKSLLSSIIFSREIPHVCFRLFVIYDGTQEDFESDWIRNYIVNAPQLRIFLAQAGSNAESWKYALALAHGTNEHNSDSDIIYFVENDYLHRTTWALSIYEMSDYLTEGNYIALYDHADKYTYENYKELTSKIIVSKSTHWRETPSTCGTFMANRRTIKEDTDTWLSLPDHAAFTHIRRSKSRGLVTPLPGLNTHCMQGLLSPCIDWKAENDKYSYFQLPTKITWRDF